MISRPPPTSCRTPRAWPPSGSAVEAAEHADDIALAAVLGERKRDLAGERLVDFFEMARRVDVDLETPP